MNLSALKPLPPARRSRESNHRDSRPSFQIVNEAFDGRTSELRPALEISDPDTPDDGNLPDGNDLPPDPTVRSWRHYPDLPEPRTSPHGEMARAPLSQIRLILRELDSCDYDVRTVLTSCQDFAPDSTGFRKAYLEARLAMMRAERQHSARHQLCSLTPYPVAAAEARPASPLFHVFDLVDLARHLGFWVLVAGGLELWNSWQIAGLLDHYLLGGRAFLAIATALGFLGLDSLLWLKLRGGHVRRFTLPGVILITSLLAIAVAFHFHGVIVGMASGDHLPR
jgi:hypothetical protein